MYIRGDLRSVYIENIYIIGLVYISGPKVDLDVGPEMYTLICVCYVRALVCVVCRLQSVLCVGFSVYRDSSVTRFRAPLDVARFARFRGRRGGQTILYISPPCLISFCRPVNKGGVMVDLIQITPPLYI